MTTLTERGEGRGERARGGLGIRDCGLRPFRLRIFRPPPSALRLLRLLLRLLDLAGRQQADPPGDDHAQLVAAQRIAQRLLEGLGVGRRVDHHDVFDAQRAGEVLDHQFAGRLVAERAAGGGMLLQAGHRRGAVVEDQHDVAGGRRIVDHFDQAGDAAVDERAVADDAHHPPGLLLGQHVAQAQAHADAGAHAELGVHSLEGRQRAQRVAADVAGDDAIELPEQLERDAMGATDAQGRRLAGRQDRLRARCRRRGSFARAPRRTRRSGTFRAFARPRFPPRGVARRDTDRPLRRRCSDRRRRRTGGSFPAASG